MERQTRGTVAVAALATFALLPSPAEARHISRVGPRAFGSCARLVTYARTHFAATHGVPDPPVAPLPEPLLAPVATNTPAAGTAPAPSAASAPSAGNAGATSFSTTNDQEQGVDEPDIVKTDGSTVFALVQGTLEAISVRSGTPKLAGTLALGPEDANGQLLLRGSRLIVISGGTPLPIALPGRPLPAESALSPYFERATTTVTEVDVADPAAMKVTRTMTVAGSFVDARQNGATARLVISSPPPALAQPGLRGSVTGWVPHRSFHSLLTGRRYVRPVARCAAIDRPAQFSGVGMLTILTLDLDRGLWTASSDALMADAQVVYGSTRHLFVATQKWVDPSLTADSVPPSQTTVIDELDATSPDTTTLIAAGQVPGYLLNQFSLSEYGGDLRVATTSRPIWWGGPVPQTPAPSQSYVTVLAQQGGALVPVGQVAGLGAGQQIYSVRFVGDAGYVVTFRQVDPLYVLDLSRPTAPRVTGQLELAGVSSYLQPLTPGLLLGIGEAVGADNEPSGTQLDLFDVSNPGAPRLVTQTALGNGSSSTAQYDHHAFLYWPPTGLAVLPVSVFTGVGIIHPLPSPPVAVAASDAPAGFTGAIGYHVDASGISEVGRVMHDPVNGYSPPILRSLVVGDQLYTLSSEGLMSSSLDTLQRDAFVTFPTNALGA